MDFIDHPIGHGNKVRVSNIELIRVEVAHGKFANWRFSKDHSKWLFGEGGSFGCIGDLNRMESQEARGFFFFFYDYFVFCFIYLIFVLCFILGGGSICSEVLGPLKSLANLDPNILSYVNDDDYEDDETADDMM